MASSRHFRIGWTDRIRAILFGQVRRVHAEVSPHLIRSSHGGASFTLVDDPFGFCGDREAMCLPLPMLRPCLVVEEPEGLRARACPACGSVVPEERVRDHKAAPKSRPDRPH